MSSTIPTTIDKAPTLSRGAEILIKAILVIGGPLLLLGLLEGGAYLWERGQANSLYAWELVASRRIELESYYEPGAGYTLLKPGSHYEWQSIPVDINSHGLRSPETTYEKPPDTFRILNLGDSVAMGWGVREEDTYGRRLETLLNTKAAGTLRYEVINAGTPGWNLENELAYLEAEGLKYDPDLVLLDLTIVNDIYGKSALQGQNRPNLIEWLRANTYFWPFLTVQLRWIEARAKGRERIPVLDPPKDPAFYYPLDVESDQWTAIWDCIVVMSQLAEKNKARFALLLFPLEYQVLDETYSTLPQDLLTTRAAKAGISVLDLLPSYQQACQKKPGGPCYLEDRYLFADVWMHPSAYGHELTATEIEAFLNQMLNESDYNDQVPFQRNQMSAPTKLKKPR
jgi:hypothetical protein